MEDKAVDMSLLATHKIKLEDYEKGLDMARQRPEGFVKAIFTFED